MECLAAISVTICNSKCRFVMGYMESSIAVCRYNSKSCSISQMIPSDLKFLDVTDV